MQTITMMNHTIAVVSNFVRELPAGKNLVLLHFLWMLVSGALLPNRGAIFTALNLHEGGIEQNEIRFGINFTARRNYLPEHQKGRKPKYDGRIGPSIAS